MNKREKLKQMEDYEERSRKAMDDYRRKIGVLFDAAKVLNEIATKVQPYMDRLEEEWGHDCVANHKYSFMENDDGRGRED